MKAAASHLLVFALAFTLGRADGFAFLGVVAAVLGTSLFWLWALFAGAVAMSRGRTLDQMRADLPPWPDPPAEKHRGTN